MTPQEPREVVERLREMTAGKKNAVGDYWGSHVLAEAADLIESLTSENATLRGALAFAQSAIKSGEPWTDVCESIIGGALNPEGNHEDE